MIQEAIRKTVEGISLSAEEAERVMGEIMDGEATPAQIAALVVALRMKGETVEEMSGFARAMRVRAQRITPRVSVLVDTCGTGGDGAHTFNISTTTAFVVAGCGVAVAKHGNRAVSSACGSADVLEALGLPPDAEPARVQEAIERIGLGFLFAPRFHPAMRHAVGPRREIGIRTIFNVLGPLTNPAGARRQVIGVYDPRLVEPVALVARELGTEHAYVVHGDGLDELTTTGPTWVAEVRDGHVRTFQLEPEEVGLPRASREALRGGDARHNARLVERVLQGERGPCRDVVLLNAAAALVAAGAAEDLREGILRAGEAIDSGAAQAKLEALRAYFGAQAGAAG